MVQLDDRGAEQAVDRPIRSVRAVMASVALASAGAVVIARWWTGTGYQPPPKGLPDSGAFTSLALPVAGAAQELAAVAVVGLLFARCVLVPRCHEAAHRRLAVITARWAAAWAASSLAVLVLTMSDAMGVPLLELSGRLDVVAVLLGSPSMLGQLTTLWVACGAALFAARPSGRAATGAGLVVVAAALLPATLAGHAGHHNSPTMAMTVLAVHVLAAAVWIGGLLALTLHLRAFPDALRDSLPRFSSTALLCAIGVGVSGVAESAIMLDTWGQLVESDRGHLMIAKVVALAVLLCIGYWHRSSTMGAAAAGRLWPLIRLAGVELVVMGATVGIAVVLSGTA
ncbi:copper resistance D family protein [Nakamurella sp. GG22]